MTLFKKSVMVDLIKLSLLAVFMVVLTVNTTKEVWMHDRFQILVETVDVRCDEGITSLPSFCEYFNGIDRIYNVFAAVYDRDLKLLTSRNPDITPGRTVFFEPLKYPAVITLINFNENGFVSVSFDVKHDNGKVKTLKTPVYYRWVENYLVMMATPFIPDTIDIPRSHFYIFLATALLLFLSTITPLVVLYRSERRREKCPRK
jgi:hypothetical protein